MDWQKLRDELKGVRVRSKAGVTYTATGEGHIELRFGDGPQRYVTAQLRDLASGTFETLGKEN